MATDVISLSNPDGQLAKTCKRATPLPDEWGARYFKRQGKEAAVAPDARLKKFAKLEPVGVAVEGESTMRRNASKAALKQHV
jgi:hypothetical protein